MKNDLDGIDRVLVTGGTGSLGQALVKRLLATPTIARVVVFSRDELKQYEMANDESFAGDRRIRFFIGDVRDLPRVHRAMEGIDTVVHAAALKQVPAAEYNPFEFVKTNVLGAQNVIDACLDAGVRRVVALSTDKAAAPVNLYGATKLCSDKLFVAANNFKGSRDLRFSVVRYGNVVGSRGSVIPFFLKKRRTKSIPVTSPEMTRFSITLDRGVDLILFALNKMWGGEIFVPKIPSYRILDVAEAIAPECKVEIVGLRPGEKIHEEMITATDSLSSLEFRSHFVILPPGPKWNLDEYANKESGQRYSEGRPYNSGTNADWLSVQDIRQLVRLHVDPDFEAG